ncbi:MAG: sulfotransferase, partial [Pirellulaceae bacterium]
QEDEFALISLGAPSPLLRMAFPNDPPPYLEFLDKEDVDERDLRQWQRKMREFVTMQMYRKRKPIVLKSPTHTGRVQILADMFPRAKFIHITRNPYELFSSTKRLWAALDEVQAFQLPHEHNLEEYVYTALERMYRGFERQRSALPPGSICDVRYEDLIQDPVGTMRQIYEQLQLGDFEAIRPRVERSMQQRRGHKINRHDVPAQQRSEIERRWGTYLTKYGYSAPTSASEAKSAATPTV